MEVRNLIFRVCGSDAQIHLADTFPILGKFFFSESGRDLFFGDRSTLASALIGIGAGNLPDSIH